jgi:hypothetical protein
MKPILVILKALNQPKKLSKGNKHSSLLLCSIIYEEKKFYNADPQTDLRLSRSLQEHAVRVIQVLPSSKFISTLMLVCYKTF